MAFETFENLDETNTTEAVVPFQFRKDKSQEGTLEWLNHRFQRVYEGSFPRFLLYRRYINMYKNVAQEDGGD